jgi:glycosyltransferase involved in cell wall biosynthesis
LKILHHERKRLASHFSIERLFAEIRRHMSPGCAVSPCPAPEASAGLFPRIRNLRHCARQRADVHHIVGDSHYLVFGLPPEKTVLTIHDCGALNRLSGLKRALLKYFWFTGPMRRAAVVTTISHASKDELRKWVGSLADKVVVVPDCCFEEFTYDSKPFNEEQPVVLQVGTKWNKNVERVMEAVAGTGCRLEVVGTMQRDQKTESRVFETARGTAEGKLKDEKTKGLKDKGPQVRELGRLTDEELVEAYRRCDMVVFASLYEGFGLPILEAQAVGRPVITSNFGAMREAAGDGALLVDPYSVEAIREAVLRIKREPALREDLIAKGRRNVERFRAEAVAARYGELYRNLATD